MSIAKNYPTTIGHALLEILIAQMIVGLSAGALFSLVTTAYRVDRKTQQLQHLVHTASVLRSYAARILSLSDTHRLAISPQAGSASSVVTIDGRTIAQVLQASSVGPSPRYGSLYNVGVAAGSIFHLDGSASINRRCTTVPLSYSADRYRYSLVVSGRGIVVAPLTLHPVDNTKHCYRMSIGTPIRTLVQLPNAVGNNENGVRAILPIEREEALYVDQSRRLRYVRFEGGQSVENQPLSHEIEDLSFSVSTSVIEQISVYSIAVTLRISGLSKVSFSLSSNLGRQNWWNTLLWAI